MDQPRHGHVGERAHVLAVAAGQPGRLAHSPVVGTPVDPHIVDRLFGVERPVQFGLTRKQIGDAAVLDVGIREGRVGRGNAVLRRQVGPHLVLVLLREDGVVGEDLGHVVLQPVPTAIVLRAPQLVDPLARVIVVANDLQDHEIGKPAVAQTERGGRQHCAVPGSRHGIIATPGAAVAVPHVARARLAAHPGAPVAGIDHLRDDELGLGVHVGRDRRARVVDELDRRQTVDLVVQELQRSFGSRRRVPVAGLIQPSHHATAVGRGPRTRIQVHPQPVRDEQFDRRRRREVGDRAPGGPGTVGHVAGVVVRYAVQSPGDVRRKRFEREDGSHRLGMLPVRGSAVGARVDGTPTDGHIGRAARQELAVERGPARHEGRGAAGVVDRRRAERPEGHGRLRPHLVQHVARVERVIVRLRRGQARGRVAQADAGRVGVRPDVLTVAVRQPGGLVGGVVVRTPIHPHVVDRRIGVERPVQPGLARANVADVGIEQDNGTGRVGVEVRIGRRDAVLPGQVTADLLLVSSRQDVVIDQDLGHVHVPVPPGVVRTADAGVFAGVVPGVHLEHHVVGHVGQAVRETVGVGFGDDCAVPRHRRRPAVTVIPKIPRAALRHPAIVVLLTEGPAPRVTPQVRVAGVQRVAS